jgi:hypothetical protein
MQHREFALKHPDLYDAYNKQVAAGNYSCWGYTDFVYNKGVEAGKNIVKNKELKELEDKLQSCEEANKSLRKQISEDTRVLEEEYNDIVNRPTVLAAHLAALGFKGTLIREQPFFNSNVSMDKRVGLYTETLKVE